MNKRVTDKLANKRTAWLERTALILHLSDEEVVGLLSSTRKQSVRINSLQGDPEQIIKCLEDLGWTGEQYSWCPEGYSVETGLEAVRDSELVAEGKVFIQNAASWLPVLALDPQPNEKILDVCAAPGGKTSHIAARTNNEANIWTNDNSRSRLIKLQANMRRLGGRVVQYTLYDATMLARKLGNQQFDKILLDAPCSGEGLMNYTCDKDFATWSVAHIKRLQQLQKRILGQAWQLLEPGGVLVYSTCTMAPEENEAVIDYFLRSHLDANIEGLDFSLPNAIQPVKEWNGKQYASAVYNCLRLAPSENIEAFFVCKLRKLDQSALVA